MSRANSEASASEETDSFGGYPRPRFEETTRRCSSSPRKFKMNSTPLVVSKPKLHNSLVEMCVLVGVDEDTGLKIKDFSQDPAMDPFESLDEVGPVDTQVLAVITPQSAYYPQSKDIQIDPRYPVTTSGSITPTKSPKKLRRTSSRHHILRMISSNGQAIPQSINHEMVNSLPPLCFPDEAYVISQSKHRIQETIHTLVLTSMTGVRTYATCLSFHVPYSIQQSKSREPGFYDLKQGTDIYEKNVTTRWVPKCICLITQAPYFGVMKKILSSLLPDLQQSEQLLLKSLKNMLYYVAMVPMPPPGNLSVEFSINDVSIVVAPPDDTDKPVVDIALHIPFLSFSVMDTLRIVTFILMQQPIIFIASNYALLTHVMECFMVFILPFKWPFTYVPIVSTMLLDLLEAPGVFLMGCHSEHSKSVKEIKGMVVVDIDQGSIEACQSVKIPTIPKQAVSVFMENFSSVRRYMVDLLMVGRPDPTSLESANCFTDKMHRKFQLEIQNHFLEFMANLFRDIQDFISPEIQCVKKEDFVMSRPEDERYFYKKIMEQQMFKTFLDDRLDKKQDYYTRLERRTRPQSSTNIGLFSDFPRYHPSTRVQSAMAMRRKSSASTDNIKQQFTPHTHLTLPSFDLSLDEASVTGSKQLTAQVFFDKCVTELTEVLSNVRNTSIKASYLYLRGMFHIANSHFITGLEDLCNLNTVDLSIMPINFMAKVIADLPQSDVEVVKRNPFYRSKEFLSKVEQKNCMRQQRLHYKEFDMDNLPEKLDLEDFIKRIQIMEIAMDKDVIERLFKALTVGNDELLSDTFSSFVDSWKDNGTETDAIYPHLQAHLKEGEEYPIKVSGWISSGDGSGRLVLTQKRLVFLGDGNQKFHDVINLTDIKRMEKIEHFTSLKSLYVAALRIHSNKEGDKPYTVNLKSERNSWQLLITEMWNGRIVSHAQKDDQVITEAALNVMLLDAVIRSSESENASHARHVESAAGHLSQFTHSTTKKKKSPNALKHRINPSFSEPMKSTVEAMIYIPGTSSDGSTSDDSDSCKLWCGMASGKVKIFDGRTWMQEAEFCDAKDRVCCLMSVGTGSVWAGSFDTNIYIIDVDTYTANKKICDHSDFVSDMTVTANKTVAYTCSLDGEIMIWNTITLEKVQDSIKLPECRSLTSIKWKDGKLWCCTKEAIRVIDPSTGDELKRAVYMDEKKFPVQFDCFLTYEDKLWVGCTGSNNGKLLIFNEETLEVMDTLRVSCRGISKLVAVENRIWAGSKQGKIHLFNTKTCRREEKVLEAHEDAIRSMCMAANQYILTGSGSKDGKVAMWKADFDNT
ncbi:DENN domain-containing protein 3-like isoform X2 [Antedon mediterranea]|uniref:DENN domain-containing protein 3-like isoform X2 n=1 Tax=Antedon mediterranea TaxID=105859 RepID=UPI003AF988D6